LKDQKLTESGKILETIELKLSQSENQIKIKDNAFSNCKDELNKVLPPMTNPPFNKGGGYPYTDHRIHLYQLTRLNDICQYYNV